jgi:hypothetical protein
MCIGAAERPHTGELRKQRTPDQGWSGRASSEARIAQREVRAVVIRSNSCDAMDGL